MRSSSGTNFAPPASVVTRTKSTMACFAGPSFHEGSGSLARAMVVAKDSAPTSAVASRFRVRIVFIVVSFRTLIGFSN